MQVLGEDAHAMLARSVLARLFRHVRQQHEHGVVHFDLKPENCSFHRESNGTIGGFLFTVTF